MIIVKDYSNAGENWTVYHRGIDVNGDNAPETDGIYLNTTGAAGDMNQASGTILLQHLQSL